MARDIIFQLSVRSVRLHLLRSVLAALGIVIGVVAIASMGMMGANMTLSVTKELSSMANILVVRPDNGGGIFGQQGGGGIRMTTGSSSDNEIITDDQFKDIERIAAKYGLVYAVNSQSDRIEVGSDKTGRATIFGFDPAVFPDIFELEDGAFPKSTTSVMIGPNLADRYGLTIGSKIAIGEENETTTVRVVGILQERGLAMDLNTDSAIIGSDKLYFGMYGGEGEYRQVNIILDDVNDADFVGTEITDQLNKKENVVSVQDSSRMLENITSTLGTITTFVMAIAGISLLVAAVSIFNVMMMSVTERIREIGILRSIGTQKAEIRKMFIYEACILGIIGAVIGALLSIAMGYLVVLGMVGSTDYFFSPESLMYIPFAMAVGVIICVVSGVYPAWSASNLDPIEALRAE
jgi:putative ABC transport system permease protein